MNQPNRHAGALEHFDRPIGFCRAPGEVTKPPSFVAVGINGFTSCTSRGCSTSLALVVLD